MSQNIIQITLSDEQVAAAAAALDQLEAALSAMISLDAAVRRRLNKMGQKSEVFCRQCLSVLAQNPQIVPPSLDLAAAQADLDRLRPLLDRVARLSERGTHSTAYVLNPRGIM